MPDSKGDLPIVYSKYSHNTIVIPGLILLLQVSDILAGKANFVLQSFSINPLYVQEIPMIIV